MERRKTIDSQLSVSEDFGLRALKDECIDTLEDLRETKDRGATRQELKACLEDIYEVREELGFALLDRRHFKEGLVLYQSLHWKTYGEETYSAIRRVLNETGHPQESKKVFERGIKRFPVSDMLRIGLGIVFDGLEDYKRSLECFGRALQLAPDDPIGLFNKAFALMNLKRFEEAVAILDNLIEGIRMNPNIFRDEDFVLRRWVIMRKLAGIFKGLSGFGRRIKISR
jgi:tetratricopeptide (TPR) repeat protein